jgi:hypothetical protein
MGKFWKNETMILEIVQSANDYRNRFLWTRIAN